MLRCLQRCSFFGTRWRLGYAAVFGLTATIAGNLILSIALAIPLLRHYGSEVSHVRSVVSLLVTMALTAAGACGYTLVGAKKERSFEFHAHGFVLFVMMLCTSLTLAAQFFDLSGSCGLRAASLSLSNSSWAIYKTCLILLMKQKMMALGPPLHCCVRARQWAHAVAVSVFMIGTTAAAVYVWITIVILGGLTCDGFQELVSLGASDTVGHGEMVIFAATLLLSIASVMLLICGTGMLYTAHRLRRRARSKLAERQVPGKVLAGVERTVRQHVLGVFASIVTSQLVVLAVGADNLLFDAIDGGAIWHFVADLSVLVDNAGDLAGILLLSGIGAALFEEDPETGDISGDISGQIRGLLHSAVMAGRAEMVFEGSLEAPPEALCVVSFPGRYMADWQALTWACEQGDISSACVFLPRADSKGRFGEHAAREETPGKCWCHSIYGDERLWGCVWFVAWQRNLRLAVDRNLELAVVYFPGEAGMGEVRWEDLGRSNLWDGVGLGGSQKAEVAFVRMLGLPVTELDLGAFRSRVSKMRPH